jgi:hypothetical protein
LMMMMIIIIIKARNVHPRPGSRLPRRARAGSVIYRLFPPDTHPRSTAGRSSEYRAKSALTRQKSSSIPRPGCPPVATQRSEFPRLPSGAKHVMQPIPPTDRLKSPLVLVLHETHLCARGASAIEFRGHALHVCSSSEEAVPASQPSYAQAYA